MRFSTTCLALLLLLGCADPCADVTGPATVVLGGSNLAGDTFEPFDDGADRPLIEGPQIGMHIWLDVRTTGLCPTTASVDRRVVVDATDEIIDVQRGPVRFDMDAELGTFRIAAPFTMFLCPSSIPVVGERLRFMVRVEDGEGRAAAAEKAFVAVCTTGDCGICTST